jgi:hypothetical protein
VNKIFDSPDTTNLDRALSSRANVAALVRVDFVGRPAIAFRDSNLRKTRAVHSLPYCGTSAAAVPTIRTVDPNRRKLLNVRSLRLSKFSPTLVTTCALTGRI